MRAYAGDHDVVMEGRDIGSVVFPDTPYKFYIDASPEVRLRRRAGAGPARSDRGPRPGRFFRRASPLIIAEDAHVIDSSNLTIDGVVGEIIGRLKDAKAETGERLPILNPTLSNRYSESVLLVLLQSHQAGWPGFFPAALSSIANA